jgi:hypothetical protein
VERKIVRSADVIKGKKYDKGEEMGGWKAKEKR